MRLNKVFVLVALLVALLTFASCITITGDQTATEPPTASASAPTTTDGALPQVGKVAPGFELENLDGETVSLESLRGRYVMLNFWATWCGPCRYEMPFIQEIYEDPEWSEAGLLIVAVNFGESASQARAYMDAFGFGFRVLLDSDKKTAAAYNIRGIPTTFFIDRDGIIRDIRVGPFLNRAEIEAILTDLIGG